MGWKQTYQGSEVPVPHAWLTLEKSCEQLGMDCDAVQRLIGEGRLVWMKDPDRGLMIHELSLRALGHAVRS